jgi:thiamine-phosphate pyrophosphorylase
MAWPPGHPIIAFVTDRARAVPADDPDALVRRIAAAARAGVDLVQVRERDLDDRALLSLVRRAREAAAGTGARVVVNDRLDVALAAQADGVHLRADAFAASRARVMAPAPFLIGRSVHTRLEASDAADDGGCDYLFFGTVFPSARTGCAGVAAIGVFMSAPDAAAIASRVDALRRAFDTRSGVS